MKFNNNYSPYDSYGFLINYLDFFLSFKLFEDFKKLCINNYRVSYHSMYICGKIVIRTTKNLQENSYEIETST